MAEWREQERKTTPIICRSLLRSFRFYRAERAAAGDSRPSAHRDFSCLGQGTFRAKRNTQTDPLRILAGRDQYFRLSSDPVRLQTAAFSIGGFELHRRFAGFDRVLFSITPLSSLEKRPKNSPPWVGSGR